MKKALRCKSTYIVGAFLAVFGIGLPFIIWGIVYFASGNRDFPYHMTMLIIGVVLFILGLIFGDAPIIIFKRKCGEIDPVIPDDVIFISWKLKWPFYFGSLATLIAIGIIGIIYLITKTWPLF